MPDPPFAEAVPGTGYWCRHCEEPVTVARNERAVHGAAGNELCVDGAHVATPDTTDPARRAAARKLTREFPGWQIAW
jgi:hypothetical protein